MKPYFLFFYVLVVLSCTSDNKKYTQASQTTSSYVDGYVGDQSCVACHQTEVEQWKGSHHDLAMQEANESTVLGDFNDVHTQIDGVTYHFYKNDSKFKVQIAEIDGSKKEYTINYTFGVFPLQQYLIDFEKGKKQVLRITWDVVAKKWYHQYKGDKISPHDWLHWTKSAQNWNTMCAECHSTNLKKNYSIGDDSFSTSYSSINVSCESCHGPAEKHIQWAENSDYEGNPNIIASKGQKQQLDVCATCHARRIKLTENYVPGETFENQYRVQNITNEYYHGDGQIDEEDYVYGSFLQSKMHAEGVKCNDCHNVHSLELKFEGNKLCLQCHVPAKYETEQHYFHSPNTEASLCINCHMTGETYMGNDYRRDHSFRIPRPDQSSIYNTPNACNSCHTDKSNEWAAQVIKDKFGDKRTDHFSDHLLLSSHSTLTNKEKKSLHTFINDLQYPAIARATVIENLEFYTQEDYAPLIEALNDPSPQVRFHALLKFRNIPPQDRLSIAIRHMQDTTKMVRIAAAQLVIGLDENQLNNIDKQQYLHSKNELETMLFTNADFSNGRMQLGDYYLQLNNISKAIEHYKVALEKDSLLLPVYSNLATAYSMVNDLENTTKTLDTWMLLDSSSSRPYYLKGLLYFELGKPALAIETLQKAISVNPEDDRSYYNLATYFYQENKELTQAESYIKKALEIIPNQPDYEYLLALIYQAQGKKNQAEKILKKLQAN